MSIRFRVSDFVHCAIHEDAQDEISRNEDLIVLRKLISQENDVRQQDPSQLVSTYFGASAPRSNFSVDRFGAPGQWAAEARRRSANGNPLQHADVIGELDEAQLNRRTQAAMEERWPARESLQKARAFASRFDADAHVKERCTAGEENGASDVTQQVEAAEGTIASSWLSRLFSLGGFRTQERSRSSPLSEPLESAWIPEHADAAAAEQGPDHADRMRRDPAIQAEPSHSTVTNEAEHRQGIASSLGLVLRTNADNEVVFCRALVDSPANALLETEEGRLQEDDVLFALDGEPIYKLPLSKVLEKLAGEDDTVAALHFLRGNPAGADQEQSIKEGKCRRTFITLIRKAPACSADSELQSVGNSPPNPQSRNRAFDFCVEAEELATDRLGRQPLLSELHVQPRMKIDGGDAEQNLGCRSARFSQYVGGKTKTEIDVEVEALMARVSNTSRLSLGHTMLRKIEKDVDPMTSARIASLRDDEDVALRLKRAAEDARQQHRSLREAQNALKSEAVGKVRDFASEWGDRERRIGAYLGLYGRSDGASTHWEGEADHRAASRSSATCISGQPQRIEVRPSVRHGEAAQQDFDVYLNSLKEAEAKNKEEASVSRDGSDKNNDDGGEVPTYVPVRTPAKSYGLKALQAEKDRDVSFVSIRSADDDDASSEDSSDLKPEMTARRSFKAGGPEPWVIHAMVYEVENLPKSDALTSPDPYVCLSALRENPMCADSNGSKYRICHNTSKQLKDAHFAGGGDVYKANVEYKTATKTSRLNASFEEEFRIYSSQATPSFVEVRPSLSCGSSIEAFAHCAYQKLHWGAPFFHDRIIPECQGLKYLISTACLGWKRRVALHLSLDGAQSGP